MSGQLSYSYQTPKGVAGGLYDISPYAINSRVNAEENDSALKFGMGAVQGSSPGLNVKVPSASDTADKFEGIVLTGFTCQMNTKGEVKIFPLDTVGLLSYGRAWGRVVAGVSISYGDAAFLVKSGENAGLFTNDPTGNLAVNGRFIGANNGGIAPIEIFNQKT